MTTPLDASLARYLPALEAELRDLLAPVPLYKDHFQMLHYHMGWLDVDLRPTQGPAGKRVRPVLCILACEAAGGKLEHALPAAAGLEALHNFSLLHDDIEDASDLRRGRPTVWKLWGVPQAINAGDSLFALAYAAFTRLPERGVPVKRAWVALQAFNQTCVKLTQGQHLDMDFEDRLDVTVSEYVTMIEGKTAALVAASAYLGALLAGTDETTASHYREFGLHLGVAFQVQDDILGIWGDSEATGKSTSSDIETRKKTLPVVYGLEKSPTLQQLYQTNLTLPHQIDTVVEILNELGARQMAEEKAAQHHQLSIDALNQTNASGEAGTALREMAVTLLRRAN
jgi:geranylgeranyl diphosphate synthase type I